VYSIKETDKALTTINRANNIATMLYISLNIKLLTMLKVAMLHLSNYPLLETLTL
jgi:hypothetical protein